MSLEFAGSSVIYLPILTASSPAMSDANDDGNNVVPEENEDAVAVYQGCIVAGGMWDGI